MELKWTLQAYNHLVGKWGLIPAFAIRMLLLSWLWHRATGTYLSIISGRRSPAAQLALHKKYLSGQIAHDAAARSWHLVGRAADIRPLPPGTSWSLLGELAAWLGLKWGGTFTSPADKGDVDHFALPGPELPPPAWTVA